MPGPVSGPSPGLVQGDQKENKSRMLPHLLFYRNVCLGLSHTDNYAYKTTVLSY
jgi:hypothetical protein